MEEKTKNKQKLNYALPFSETKELHTGEYNLLLMVTNSRNIINLAGEAKKDYLGGNNLERLFKLKYIDKQQYTAGLYFLRLMYNYQQVKRRFLSSWVADYHTIGSLGHEFEKLNFHLVKRNRLYPNTIMSLLTFIANDQWSVSFIYETKKALQFISSLTAKKEFRDDYHDHRYYSLS